MKICENCGIEYYTIYGSGRFCCEKCARSFSTKEKRKEINEKVSQTLGKWKHDFSVEEFIDTCLSSRSMTSASKKLNLPFSSFRRLAKKYGIYDTNPAWSKDLIIPVKKIDIFIENSSMSRNALKTNYTKICKKENKYFCHICNNFIWNNKELLLEVHHINGITSDNRLENLQLLCPNCHSQTENYKGKNVKKISIKITDDQIKQAIFRNNSVSDILKDVGLTPSGGNYNRIMNFIKDLKIDIKE